MRIIRRVLAWYTASAAFFFVWFYCVLQFRACGLFDHCPRYTVRIGPLTDMMRAIIPDAVIYSGIFAFTRALVWLPNAVASVFGVKGVNFLDWLFVRDVPSFENFFDAIAAFLNH